jgi:hypothetical protein
LGSRDKTTLFALPATRQTIIRKRLADQTLADMGEMATLDVSGGLLAGTDGSGRKAVSEPVALSTQERKSLSIIQEITLMMNNVRAALARALYEQAVALQ